jgi:dihydrofolate reductase
MGKVTAGATVSLDGYIAGPDETGFEHLFAWFDGGDVPFPSANPNVQFNLTEIDHRYLRSIVDATGAFLVGRRLFDITDGWGGQHPFDKPIVVVTHAEPVAWIAEHPGAPFTFATDGLESALAQAKAIAGDLDVGVTAGKIASQCLELGLLDELSIDLAPVLLGGGVPFFELLNAAPILLDGPTLVIEGERVTHLRYTIRRS